MVTGMVMVNVPPDVAVCVVYVKLLVVECWRHLMTIRAFAGDVYRGFDAVSAEPETIAFAQDHLRILAGLYAVLRPLDAIRPHRLELGTRWEPEGDKLTGHCGDRVARPSPCRHRRRNSRVDLQLAPHEH